MITRHNPIRYNVNKMYLINQVESHPIYIFELNRPL